LRTGIIKECVKLVSSGNLNLVVAEMKYLVKIGEF